MRLYIVDSFTDTAFAGNPAGVVLLDAPADPGWMQSVAAELKHSETAFVETGGDGPKSLRWFTPTVEVDLCGYATLATGHVLGGEQVFATRSGELRTRIDFVSRVFGPAVGVPEDPVTGSAHCLLSPYWAERLGREKLVGEQASERGGIVRVQLNGDRVTLAGQAVTVASGELLI